MTSIREKAYKHFPDLRPANEPNRLAMCDVNFYARKACEAALREFGEELAKLCEAQKIEPVGLPGYAAYNAAFTRCAAAIRAAIRESL